MATHQTEDRATWPKEKWADASLEDLEKERTEILRRLQRLETQIDEARQLAEIYGNAGEQLQSKATSLRAEADRFDATADQGAAAQARHEAAESERLAKENFRKADDKARLATTAEQAAFADRSLSLSIAARIKQRASRWENWEL